VTGASNTDPDLKNQKCCKILKELLPTNFLAEYSHIPGAFFKLTVSTVFGSPDDRYIERVLIRFEKSVGGINYLMLI